MKKILLFCLCSTAFLACNKKADCGDLTGTYTTFVEARKDITKANYPVKHIQSTPESSWIKRIEYYSCDGAQGYLIIYTTRAEEYIHAHVPIEVWKEFSTSKSKGSYYNTNIVNRYVFEIKP
ncbi:KTSC domain-containing protein [Flavobacterium sp. xlx-214]|uniref:KTSC domain-containing protein n=1 Tax=unclassified Flavobacterium TaxID=196869 RepID=UPI0013D85CE2|nr:MULTISPECIES: KTSC domain-containing protein [unclassified Flavobacterium]MBA5791404.1 KTSC domain-containing protein [Flavobacterium sp. xlx-221]QMI83444.1 KTSC domain-containing protein [Flavobacterium sp. xlx-214]